MLVIPTSMLECHFCHSQIKALDYVNFVQTGSHEKGMSNVTVCLPLTLVIVCSVPCRHVNHAFCLESFEETVQKYFCLGGHVDVYCAVGFEVRYFVFF